MDSPDCCASSSPAPKLDWSELPSLPPARGETCQPGLAGAFIGVHGGVLIVAGGANFHDRMPWQGGQKSWEDGIYALEYQSDDPEWLVQSDIRLSGARAYGFSASTTHGVLCVGGADAQRHYADVFLLRWNAESRQVEREELPPLPKPMAYMSGGCAGENVYVLGGQAKEGEAPLSEGCVLDLAGESPRASEWKPLPDLPGSGRVFHLSFALGGLQHAGFYVFGGRRQSPGGLPELFRDSYRYDPACQQWTRLRDLPAGADFPMMAGAMVPVGDKGGILVGGDDGELFLAKEKLALDIREERAADSSGALASLLAAEKNLLENHPGFCRTCYYYAADSDEWTALGSFPGEPPVTTTTVLQDDVLLLPSGEVRPGVRTSQVWAGKMRFAPTTSLAKHVPCSATGKIDFTLKPAIQ